MKLLNKKTKVNKYRSGFTLIELLVVISIISLLSSIVLVQISNARIKGRNSQRLQLVRQYANALALYALDNNGLYPTDSGPGNYCLGTTGYCFTYGTSYPTGFSTSINTALSPYISALPSDPYSTTMASTIFGSPYKTGGIVYFPRSLNSNGIPTKFSIEIFVEQVSSCPPMFNKYLNAGYPLDSGVVCDYYPAE